MSQKRAGSGSFDSSRDFMIADSNENRSVSFFACSTGCSLFHRSSSSPFELRSSVLRRLAACPM